MISPIKKLVLGKLRIELVDQVGLLRCDACHLLAQQVLQNRHLALHDVHALLHGGSSQTGLKIASITM
jgi:hypothetical protein